MNNVTDRKWVGWVVLYPSTRMGGGTLYLALPPGTNIGRHAATGRSLKEASKFASKAHAEFWAREVPAASEYGPDGSPYEKAQVRFVAEITRLEIVEPNEEDA